MQIFLVDNENQDAVSLAKKLSNARNGELIKVTHAELLAYDSIRIIKFEKEG